MMECDVVFEGGGIKGIGLVGAVSALERAGYVFKNLAGSSAGSVVAALIAAGYTSEELYEEMLKLDYKKFKGKEFWDHFGFMGKFISLSRSHGIYEADYIQAWMHKLLEKKGIVTFGDIGCLDQKEQSPEDYDFERHKCRLQITVTDITTGKLLVFPQDLERFGIQPATFPISVAVKISSSIPIYFEPYIMTDKFGHKHYLVDGGLLSNYPIWLLDDGVSYPDRPVFGLRFIKEERRQIYKEIKDKKLNVVDYTKLVVSTMLDAHDTSYLYTTSGERQRTVFIPTTVKTVNGEEVISSTDFHISKPKQHALYDNGARAAERFLKNWDFDKWKDKHR